MPRVIDDSMVEPATRTLLGAIDVDGGATDEQRAVGNLAVHEAGFLRTETLVPKTGSLMREGATDLLAEALRRGSECSDDFTVADHLALADVPLEDVRARFGVPPLAHQ